MAYTINLTDGTIFASIADGTINTSSSMILVGKNYAGYGEFLDENFIHLLENGSNNVAPGAPLTGQLWWDKANGMMKVYNGTTFKVISGATAAASAPPSNVQGDLWFDLANGQLKVYSGTGWILVGPASTSGQGTSGSVVDTVRDGIGQDHVVIKFYVSNDIVGIFSKDETFQPATAITGFSTIGPGLQLSSAIDNAQFRGISQNALTLEGLRSSDFLSSISNDTTSGTLGILNDGGLTVGAAYQGSFSVQNNDLYIRNTQQNADVYLQVNYRGNTLTAIEIDGATGNVLIPGGLTVNGGVSVSNIAAPGSNTQVLFNDSGITNATAGLVFNKTTNALVVAGNITGGNLSVGNSTISGGNITITNNMTAAGSITSSGTVTGAFLAAGNGAITGGSLAVTGAITGASVGAIGNIQGANVIATGYLFGDGSLISNLSAGVSLSTIGNGTSNLTVLSSGGNIRANVGGVSIISITSSGIINNMGNGVGNIGSATGYFNRVFATSTSALYADVAERFAADEVLMPGTVVELGGVEEITMSRSELSDSVFGIISTRPAYLMNGGAGEDATHPPVAMTGRVPVRVVGIVRKGDRLVSAGNGVARAALPGEATAFNVIGRALEDKNTTAEGLVESIVVTK